MWYAGGGTGTKTLMVWSRQAAAVSIVSITALRYEEKGLHLASQSVLRFSTGPPTLELPFGSGPIIADNLLL